MTDPIVAEIRATREHIAQESGYDIHAIADAARRRQQTSGVKTVSRPKRLPDPNLAKPMPLDRKSIERGTDTSAPAVG
jgi:hypothetical protein